MAPEDEVITSVRRTRPDVRKLEAPHLTPPKVADKHLVIHSSASLSGAEKLDTIQVCDVHSGAVGLRTGVIIFLHVHGEKIDVHTVDALEE